MDFLVLAYTAVSTGDISFDWSLLIPKCFFGPASCSFSFFYASSLNTSKMTKRRLDDSGFANVLRQKAKEDPVIKQQAGNNKAIQVEYLIAYFFFFLFLCFFLKKNFIAQNTFALLMKAQQRPKPRVMAEPSYKYFNTVQAPAPTSEQCYRCANSAVYSKCTFCEHILCHQCLQNCGACQNLFCSTCSVIE